jgi:DNA transposition AAA+ family ATPase
MFDAVFVRASAVTNVSSLLDDICFEIGIESHHVNATKLRMITEALRNKPRPLFIDEADYCVQNGRMLEVLRDIHDTANVPVMLIGMEGIGHKLVRHPQFARRISQMLEFKPCDLADTVLTAKQLCEIELEAALVERMHQQTKGSIGHIVIALSQFEELARDNGWKRLTLAQWGDRPMFLGDKSDV